VTSTLTFFRNPDGSGKSAALKMDMGEYDIISVTLDGHSLSSGDFQTNGNQFIVPQVPDRFTLEIRNRIFPEKNTRLEGLYLSNGIYCTQCEAEGFRNITPFIDRPDVMARYTCTIMADKDVCPMLLSNGNPVEKGNLPGNRHYGRSV
jgi:aminopeptidase N